MLSNATAVPFQSVVPDKTSVTKAQKQPTVPNQVTVTKPSAVSSVAVTEDEKTAQAIAMVMPTATKTSKPAEPSTWAEKIAATPKVEPVETKPIPVTMPKVDPPSVVKTSAPTPSLPTPSHPPTAPIVTPKASEISKVLPQVKTEKPNLPAAASSVAAPAVSTAAALKTTSSAPKMTSSPQPVAKSTTNGNGAREKPPSPVKFTIGGDDNSETTSPRPTSPDVMESLEKPNKPGKCCYLSYCITLPAVWEPIIMKYLT